ncbi:tetratricopeptide repeat protein [Metabacillus halosaccharovorans]|uniref:tetratricopeptide repeat protein n=1 Tax=Metabacillus halosaccharovorans TaxID=930124 RepID=UPI0037362061
MKCQSCQNEIPQAVLELKPKNCLFCGASLHLEKQDKFEGQKLISESLWYKEAFHTFPSVLAHEYWRLYDLFNKNQTFGAILQLKDLFEVLIKFPILLNSAFIYGKKEGRSDFENKLLISLLEKPLSLGDWESIGRTMIKNQIAHPSFQDILSDIVRLFSKQSLTNWRNTHIGHGALRFEIDDEFIHEITSILLVLKKHFQTFETTYRNLTIYYENKENEKVIFVGKDLARGQEISHKHLRAEYRDYHQEVYPYLIIESGKLYFFDSYHSKKQSTDIINYPEGYKSRIVNQNFKSLFSVLSKQNQEKQFIHSIEDITYTVEEEEIMNKIQLIDDYYQQTYLIDWLKNSLAKHEKGVFLLQMERGLGKSTFSRALDPHSLHRINLSPYSVSVRGYYINDTYKYKMDHFVQEINDLLRKNDHNQLYLKGKVKFVDQHAKDLKENFAKVLNFYHEEYKKHFHTEKLIVIIDGLDEIPMTNESISILDFIPNSDQLNNGVYLMLTCRTNSEMFHIKDRISDIEVDEKLTLSRQSRENKNLLSDFMVNKMDIKEKHLIEIILEKTDYRFIYLKAFKEMIKTNPSILNDLPEGKINIHFFLDFLKDSYGEKYFKGIIRILTILATSFSPLTIKELSYLYGEEHVSFKFLAYMIDIRGFIKMERSYRGNVFTIGHIDLQNYLINEYSSTIIDLIQEWSEGAQLIQIDQIDHKNDGEMYLLSSIIDYVEHYLPSVTDFTKDDTFAKKLLKILDKLISAEWSELKINRMISMATSSIKIYEKMKIESKNTDLILMGYQEALNKRGLAHIDIYHFKEALSDLKKSQDLYKLRDKHHIDLNDQAKSLLRIGYVLFLSKEPLKALSYLNQCVTIQKDLVDTNQIYDKNELAKSLMIRAITHSALHDFNNSIDDFKQCIEIRRYLIKNRELSDVYDLGRALYNRGSTYTQLGEFELAINDYRECLAQQEHLIEEGNFIFESDYPGVLLMMAECQFHYVEYDRARLYVTKSINLYKDLMIKGKLKNKDSFYEALLLAAKIEMKHGYLEKALPLVNECMDLVNKSFDEMANSGLNHEHILASSRLLRSSIYIEQCLFDLALKDLDICITSYQRFQISRQLSICYLKKSLVKAMLNEHKKSMQYIEKAISIQKEMQIEDLLPVSLYNQAVLDEANLDKALSESIRILTRISFEKREKYMLKSCFYKCLLLKQNTSTLTLEQMERKKELSKELHIKNVQVLDTEIIHYY